MKLFRMVDGTVSKLRSTSSKALRCAEEQVVDGKVRRACEHEAQRQRSCISQKRMHGIGRKSDRQISSYALYSRKERRREGKTRRARDRAEMTTIRATREDKAYLIAVQRAEKAPYTKHTNAYTQ